MTKGSTGSRADFAFLKISLMSGIMASDFWLLVARQRSLKPSDLEGSLSENPLCHMSSMAMCGHMACDSGQIP